MRRLLTVLLLASAALMVRAGAMFTPPQLPAIDWQTFGVVAALAWGLVLLASFVWQISPLRLGFSARDKNTWAALLLFAAIATVEAQKPEQLRVGNGEWRVERKRGNLVQTTVSDADIARGYALVEEDDNAASISIPTNAVTVGNWHRHGARSSIGNHRLDWQGLAAKPNGAPQCGAILVVLGRSRCSLI